MVINPAAGQELPVLGILNRTFKQNGIAWEAFVTKDAGDARKYARASAEAGVDLVMACGGDGTIMETASGLRGSGVPLAILPCGTANVMSLELSIPGDLSLAAALAAEGNNVLRAVDMGSIGDREFLLRAGVGAEARMINETPREAKNRFGTLAYVLAGLNQLSNLESARYILDLDGLHVEADGITLFIANSINVGLPGVKLVQGVEVDDGLLDVVLIRPANLPKLISIATNALFNRSEESEPVFHWQAREITVQVDPIQPVQADGEEIPPPPFTARVIPKAVQILCPAPAPPAANSA